MDVQDVIIVGGGPAGLSAAVVLGRCLRKVLVFDTAQYRNKYSHGMHNYLTRDDILPNDFINICHQEIAKYGVQLIPKKVVRARKNGDGIFVVKDQEDQTYYAKKMLIATGLVDKVPTVQGFKEMYGKSVFHCPYCDGWEVKGKRVGVYARNKEGWELALSLKAWTNDVTLYTDGRNKVKPFQREYLEANDIPIVKTPFAHLEGDNGQLKKIVFTNEEETACDAIFFVNGYEQQCDLAETFDCEISSKGVVVTNRFQQTNTTGLYVAGDADKDVHFVVVAAAEGAKAGVTINKELQKEIMEQKLREVRTKQLIT
jgi:thioredoxin reductase